MMACKSKKTLGIAKHILASYTQPIFLQKALAIACAAGSVDLVRAFLSKQVELNQTAYKEKSPLIAAAETG